MRAIARTLLRLRRCRAGVAALEAALALPILLVIVLGGVDIVGYVAAAKKVDRLSGAIANLTARADRLRDDTQCTESDCLGMLFLAASQVAEPLDLEANGRLIVSSLVDPEDGPPEIAWQRTGPDYTIEADSKVGAEGEAFDMPEGFELPEGDNAIVVEIFYDYQPFPLSGDLLFATPALSTRLYRMAVFRPRFGSLKELEQN